jgi:hypothetical protein
MPTEECSNAAMHPFITAARSVEPPRGIAPGQKSQRASVVATDGTVTDGPYPETKEVLGGFAVVDVPSREEALEWAAKIAVACRCAQEVRELLPDPTV